MGETYTFLGGKYEMNSKLWSENIKRRELLVDTDMNGGIILNWNIIRNQSVSSRSTAL
jgi:hypothetical protein